MTSLKRLLGSVSGGAAVLCKGAQPVISLDYTQVGRHLESVCVLQIDPVLVFKGGDEADFFFFLRYLA